ncbi:MAG: MFS transporter [Halodesulfurarchaeum sp.]
MEGSSRERVGLAAVVFSVLFAQILLYPGVDSLVRRLGATTELNASIWFIGAEFAAFIVFAMVWGAASDALGRRVPLIVLGALGGAVGYLLLGTLHLVIPLSFSWIVVLRVLQGASTIGAFSLAMTMLMDLPGGHGHNMGAAGIAIGFGLALGSPVGGLLYGVGTLVPLYIAALLLLIAGGIATLLTDRAPGGDDIRIGDVLSGLRETPSLGVPYAYGFIDRVTAGFFALVGTLYFRNVFHLSPGETGITLAMFFAPFALLQYPFGKLSDRIGRTLPVVGGSATYGLGVMAIGFLPTITGVRGGMVVVGMLGALMSPATMALVTDLATESERGTAMAGFNIFGSLGFLAGVVFGGLIAGSYGYFAAFLAVGSLEVLVATLTLPFFLRFE